MAELTAQQVQELVHRITRLEQMDQQLQTQQTTTQNTFALLSQQLNRAQQGSTQGVARPRARKARTKAKESTRVSTRTVLSLRATVVTAESGDTSKKTFDTRTLLPKWMRRNLSNL